MSVRSKAPAMRQIAVSGDRTTSAVATSAINSRGAGTAASAFTSAASFLALATSEGRIGVAVGLSILRLLRVLRGVGEHKKRSAVVVFGKPIEAVANDSLSGRRSFRKKRDAGVNIARQWQNRLVMRRHHEGGQYCRIKNANRAGANRRKCDCRSIGRRHVQLVTYDLGGSHREKHLTH